METVASPPASGGDGLRLLTDWGAGQERSRSRRAALISIGLHALALVALAVMPEEFFAPPPRVEQPEPRQVARLVAPPTEPTQTTPNKGPLSREFDARSLEPRPAIQAPPSPPPRPVFRPSPGAAPGPPAVAAIAEPPRMVAGVKDTNPLPQQTEAPLAPPPQIQPQEKPRLEAPAGPPAAGRPTGAVAVPNASVSEAVRSLARGGASGGVVVGDAGVSGLGEGLNLPPSPGRQGSNLELLSDPMGVDFRPYLIRILATVRRNWFAVMPESAKLGRRGRVAIQFAIARDGSVPKLVIVGASGTEALDRAAVAGISASNPFPPLPGEFKGSQVRLQFNFAYNMR